MFVFIIIATVFATDVLHDQIYLMPGVGYSSDKGNTADVICFKPTQVIRGDQSSKYEYSQSLDIKNLKQALDISVKIGAGWSIFKASDTFEYLNSIEDDYYKLSANYYFKLDSQVFMYYSYNPETMLSQDGIYLYQNGTNPFFLLQCGDTIINSYKETALLIFSISIEFKENQSKTQFENKFGASFGPFGSASSNIKQQMDSMNLQGNIKISAFQKGGDPSQLSKSISTRVLYCDINHIDDCQQSAEALINYANSDFPTQFQKNGSIWDSPLAQIGQFQTGYKLKDIGWKMPSSYLTPEIEAAKNTLIGIQNKYSYYKSNLEPILYKYPSQLDSNYQKQVSDMYNTAKYNLNLLEKGNGEYSALDCWKLPMDCVQIANDLQGKIIDISKESVNSLMTPINHIYYDRYIVAVFWPKGSSPQCYGNINDWFLYVPPSYLSQSQQKSGIYTILQEGTFHENTIAYRGKCTLNQGNQADCIFDRSVCNIYCHGKQLIINNNEWVQDTLILSNPYIFSAYSTDSNMIYNNYELK